jgi:uncharacterized membrane protein
MQMAIGPTHDLQLPKRAVARIVWVLVGLLVAVGGLTPAGPPMWTSFSPKIRTNPGILPPTR